MKARVLVILLATATTAWAQENDDMYFTAKDRAASVSYNQLAQANRYAKEDQDAVRNNPVNPSDSYSGRGINPEYNAQGKNGTVAVQENPDYFVTNYQPKVNSKLSQNTGTYSNPNNCNCGYYNPYTFGYSPYSTFYPSYGSMFSPYSMYGGMYSPYSMYGMSPYGMYSPYGYGSGMSMSMGYGFGYGSMFNIGLNYMIGSMYNPYYGYGGYYGGGYYPTGYAVSDAHVVNARRPVRTNGLNYYADNTRATGSTVGTNGRVREGGRMANSSPNYYDATWRSNPSNYTTRSSFGGFGNQSSFGNTRSSWGNSGWGSTGGGTRSSFGGFSGGGGGSSGGGGGHSRGRH